MSIDIQEDTDLSWVEFSEEEDINCSVGSCSRQAVWRVFLVMTVHCKHLDLEEFYHCDPCRKTVEELVNYAHQPGNWLMCSTCGAKVTGVRWEPLK
jgi:hypothetical protein